MELICWAKSEIAVASATTTIMYLATTNPTTKFRAPCFDLSYLGLVPRSPKHHLEMGLVKKASKLFEGVRRHRNETRNPPQPGKEDLNVQFKGRIGQLVGAQKLLRRRSTAEAAEKASLGDKRKAAPAQEMISMHGNCTYQITEFRKPRTMADAPRIQIVEDEEEEEEEEDQLGEDDEVESEDEVDESVVEDMRKLEESFRGISSKYRLINRIGEGDSSMHPRPSNHPDEF